MTNQKFFLVAGILFTTGLIAIAAISNGWLEPERKPEPETVSGSSVAPSVATTPSVAKLEQPSLSTSLGVDESDFVSVGGVSRPRRDLAFERVTKEATETPKSLIPHPGNAPAIAKNTNPQVAGLFAELAQDKAPLEARSSMFQPEKFDREAYDADRETWLNKIRPGRVFQPAQPGPDVKPIAAKTETFQNILQGERVILEVQADPGSPVTYYTPAVGEFENRLTTQSVEASEDGLARAVYLATPGTRGLVDVLAASPTNSGQIRFQIRVSLPENQ